MRDDLTERLRAAERDLRDNEDVLAAIEVAQRAALEMNTLLEKRLERARVDCGLCPSCAGKGCDCD